MRIEPPPSLPVHAGNMPGRRPPPPTTRRAAGRCLRVPRVARDAVQRRVRVARDAELGRGGEPDDDRTRGAQPRDLGAVVRGDAVRRRSATRGCRGSPSTCASSFTPIGTPANGPGSPPPATSASISRRPRRARVGVEVADRVQVRVAGARCARARRRAAPPPRGRPRARRRPAPRRLAAQRSVTRSPRLRRARPRASCSSANASSMPACEHRDVRDRVARPRQPEVELAAVREDRDPERRGSASAARPGRPRASARPCSTAAPAGPGRS